MNQDQETSQLPTATLPTNTETDNCSQENGGQSLPTVKNENSLADRVFSLEQENLALRTKMNRERFVFVFCGNVAAMVAIGVFAPWYVYFTVLIASMMIQIVLANHWDVPWIAAPLERWLRMLEKKFEKSKLPISDDEEAE